MLVLLGMPGVAQSVKRLTLARVMISWVMGLSPMMGSVLKAQSLEPASHSVCVSPFLPPSLSLSLPSPIGVHVRTLALSLSLSLSKINKHQKIFF